MVETLQDYIMPVYRKEFDWPTTRLVEKEVSSIWSSKKHIQTESETVPYSEFTKSITDFIASIPEEKLISVSDSTYETSMSYHNRYVVVYYRG